MNRFLGILLIGVSMASSIAQAEPLIPAEVARKQADDYLARQPHDFVVTRVENVSFGWIFYYAPKRYVETQNVNDLVPGTSAIGVDRHGRLEVFSSAPDAIVQRQIDAFGASYQKDEDAYKKWKAAP